MSCGCAFAKIKARDLVAYNAKAASGEALPSLFLGHDEFADWMLDKDYADSVGAAVQRLPLKVTSAATTQIASLTGTF